MMKKTDDDEGFWNWGRNDEEEYGQGRMCYNNCYL